VLDIEMLTAWKRPGFFRVERPRQLWYRACDRALQAAIENPFSPGICRRGSRPAGVCQAASPNRHKRGRGGFANVFAGRTDIYPYPSPRALCFRAAGVRAAATLAAGVRSICRR